MCCGLPWPRLFHSPWLSPRPPGPLSQLGTCFQGHLDSQCQAGLGATTGADTGMSPPATLLKRQQ